MPDCAGALQAARGGGMRDFPVHKKYELILALVVGISGHIFNLPVWVTLLCFSGWGFLFVAEKRGWPLPHRYILWVFACAAFAYVILKAGRRFDNDDGVILLCLMACLKPFEIKTHRDSMVTIFLAYFMVVSGLFFSATFIMTIHMIVAIILITGILVRVNQVEMRFRRSIRLATALTFQAIPLAVLLFVIFPRLPDSLWSVPTPNRAETGFSTTLSPGSVSEIVKSRAIAFRAKFRTTVPGYDKRYWRGIVFQRFNGTEWKVHHWTPRSSGGHDVTDRHDYILLREDTSSRWIFALDTPVMSPSEAILFADNTLADDKKNRRRKRFDLTSGEIQYNRALAAWERVSLRLPETGNEKTRKLAEAMFNQSESVEAYAEEILELFRDGGFTYSLKPPKLSGNIVDDFIFETKEGYCEHYASAFTFMMRAAGVPARIIGGYLGGEANPYGDYLIVRQSDAHAWAEIWVKNRGWVRYDPTGVVSPERLEGRNDVGADQSEAVDTAATNRGRFADRIMNQIRLGWDAVNYFWDVRVLSYTMDDQNRLFGRIGINMTHLKGRLILLGGSLAVVMFILGGFYLYYRYLRGRDTDPAKRYYMQFVRKLEKNGIPHHTWTGPMRYAEEAVTARPDLRKEINGITRLYVLIRYGNPAEPESLLKELQRLVSRFSTG